MEEDPRVEDLVDSTIKVVNEMLSKHTQQDAGVILYAALNAFIFFNIKKKHWERELQGLVECLRDGLKRMEIKFGVPDEQEEK